MSRARRPSRRQLEELATCIAAAGEDLQFIRTQWLKVFFLFLLINPETRLSEASLMVPSAMRINTRLSCSSGQNLL